MRVVVKSRWRLMREKAAFEAGYAAGFCAEKECFVPKEWFVSWAKQYRNGFRVGQFDYKIEKR